MTETVWGSTLLIVLASALAFLGVRQLLARLVSVWARRLLFVGLVLLSLATVSLVDVNVPLAASHLRVGQGETIPGWAGLLAWVAKISMLFAVGVRPAPEERK